MRPPLIVVIAGVPSEFGDRFTSKIENQRAIATVSWLPLPHRDSYSCRYATKLHNRFVEKLKSTESANPSDFLSDANLFLLYINKEDGSEKELIAKFDAAALILPLAISHDALVARPNTPNERRHVTNKLIKSARGAIKHGTNIAAMISEEVSNRDNRTCLLLPRRNFGKHAEIVFDLIKEIAALNTFRDTDSIRKEFKKRLHCTSTSIPTIKEGGRTYFKGHENLVFKSPGKARSRHGLAPGWNDSDHEPSCVIRGRIRFGCSYDPKFHYDCKLSSRSGRRFPSCHGQRVVPRGRSHVNIAPNDNVR